MLATLKTLTLLLLAAVLAAVGLMVPAHLRSIDRSVVAWAGDQERSAADKVREVLNAAHTGPAQRIAAATDLNRAEQDELQEQLNMLLARNTQYTVSGGPAPYFEAFSSRPTRTDYRRKMRSLTATAAR